MPTDRKTYVEQYGDILPSYTGPNAPYYPRVDHEPSHLERRTASTEQLTSDSSDEPAVEGYRLLDPDPELDKEWRNRVQEKAAEDLAQLINRNRLLEDAPDQKDQLANARLHEQQNPSTSQILDRG